MNETFDMVKRLYYSEAGAPIELKPGQLEIFNAIARKEQPRVQVMCYTRYGKLISDDTPVLTNSGWKNHGDLEIGDFVFNHRGQMIRVKSVSTKGVANMEVSFSNGEVIKVHENHEWLVKHRVWKRRKNEWRVMETKEILKYKLSEKNAKGESCNFIVPNIKPIAFSRNKLPIDPYTLGAWLGDGISSKPAIVGQPSDSGIIDAIPYSVSSVQTHKTTGVKLYNFYRSDFLPSLRKLELIKNKHIPALYKHSSVKQRLALIAGLIDTDGYVGRTEKGVSNNRVFITNINKTLIDDICDIVKSLGMRPGVIEVEPCLSSSGIQGRKKVYVISFIPSLVIPTKLARKKIKAIDLRHICIKDIKPIKPVIGNCIEVDSEDGIYLAGEKLIPTHNSMTVALAALTRATSFPESWKIIGGTKEKARIIMSYINTHIFDNDYTASKFIFDKGETKEYIKRHRNKNHLTFRIGKDANGKDLYSDIKVLSAKDALGEGGENIIEDESALIPDVNHGFVMRMLGDNPHDNFLCKIGNPFTRRHFLKSHLDPAYRKINIDCYRGLLEGRITQEIIEENRPYAFFPVLFENKFPDASEIDEQGWLYLLTEDDIKLATERIVEPFGPRKLGVDVARGGRNFNVWVLRDNNTAKVLLKNLDNDLMSTAKTTMDFMKSEHVLESEVYIDDTGVGGGVVDRLREAGAKVNGVILGAKSDDPDMANLRAEVYAGKEGLHNWVKRGGKLIPHADWEELVRIRYKKKFNGVQIEPKEDMRKRGENSPDVSDALALSFAKSSRIVYRGLPDPREILSKVNVPGLNPAGGVGGFIPGIG